MKFPAGDVSVLAGHTLEVALTSDPLVRAAGEIQPDGSFTLQSPRGNVVLAGVPAGDYQARIVLSDDDSARRSAAATALPARYLEFQKSGLALRVPAERTVTLELKRR